MKPGRLIALAVGSCMFVAATLLVMDRGGLLAWIGVILAALLIVKVLRWPSSSDIALSLALLGVWAIAWAATWGYVVTTWESGEVVEVEVADGHTARVWVFDMSDGPIMYYDAPPDLAKSLLAGAPLSVTRNGHVSRGCATADRVEDLPEERIQDVFREMNEKYQHQNRATQVFYSVLGGKRDRVGVLMKLTPCP